MGDRRKTDPPRRLTESEQALADEIAGQLTPPGGNAVPTAAELSQHTRVTWPVLLALLALAGFVSGLGFLAKAAAQDASVARVETADHEKRITRLEEQRKSDAALLEKTARALEENTKALQDVKIELVKRR